MATIQVRRANVILEVPDEQKDEYLAKGFDVIGPNGKVIEKSIPNDPNSLKKAYTELSDKVKALEEENRQLKEQLASNTKPVKEEKKKAVKEPESIPEEFPEEEPEEKDFVPINRRGKKSK